jgi:hypothetical protein
MSLVLKLYAAWLVRAYAWLIYACSRLKRSAVLMHVSGLLTHV